MSKSQMVRLKYLAGINERSLSEQTEPEQEIEYIDISSVGRNGLQAKPELMRFENAPSRARRLVGKGDTIVSTVRTYLRAVWAASGDLDRIVVSTGFAVLSPKNINPQFFSWWVRSDTFIEEVVARSTGVSYPAIGAPDLGELSVRVPPWGEQRAIADYLDTETARIDALIEKKKRMIELLEERKRLWAEDELRKLRHEAPLVPLKYLVSESDLRLGPSENPLVLSVSIHRGVVPRNEITDNESRADDFANYKICRPGNIAINRMRAFQGGVGVVRDDGIVSPDYTVLRLGSEVRAGYLHHTMRSAWFVSEMTQRVRGIGSTDQGNVRTPRVNFADVGLIAIPLPTMDKQADIERHAQADEDSVDALIAPLAAQLSLLAEKRQALITAAVTGELYIPGVAA